MAREGVTRFRIRGDRDCAYNVAVTGALDGAAASSLRCLLQDLERDEVTIDLTQCSAVTDEALDALVVAARIADAHGGALRLHPSMAGARTG